jgi:hypothetical protein
MQLGEKKLIVQRASLGAKNLSGLAPATIQVRLHAAYYAGKPVRESHHFK